ncbi:MAG: DUF6378 domain-containing protein [Pseudomonadota bacterium]
MKGSELLVAASEAYIDRMERYGTPQAVHEKAADMWTAILDTPVTAKDVALCMAALKIARLAEGGHHDDSAVDIAGYAAVYQEIAHQRGEGEAG